MSNNYNQGYYKKKPASKAKKSTSEGKKYGHPVLDAASKAMKAVGDAVTAVSKGKKTTKKASDAYAKRNKDRIKKAYKKAGGE